ncbi:MAG: hypothetical protein ACE5GB_02380 [Acidimicrobiales bacterium]
MPTVMEVRGPGHHDRAERAAPMVAAQVVGGSSDVTERLRAAIAG